MIIINKKLVNSNFLKCNMGKYLTKSAVCYLLQI